MSYKGFCTVCRNPHKGMHINTSGRALNGSHRSCFHDGRLFKEGWSERQQQLIDGTYEGEVRKWDVNTLIKKAEHFEMYELAQQVYEKYSYLFEDSEPDDYTLSEAQNILDELTPDDLK